MQLSGVLMLAACLQVSAGAFGQKVTLVDKNVPLRDVFKEIRKQTDYNFIYSNKTIRQATAVTLNLRNATVKEALDSIFTGQPLTYAIEDGVIIVKLKPARPDVSLVLPDKVITGRVTDSATGQPLAGVTIKVKGSTLGAVTDENGGFSLETPDDAALEVSYVGYEKKEVYVNNRESIQISLVASATGLNQLVVVGYGTQKKSDLTGAIGSVSLDPVNAGVVSSVNQLLKGKISGVNVTQNDGKPGAALSINIRGAGSINASNRPLYVIDGIPISDEVGFNSVRAGGITGSRATPRSPLATLNPNDIESIEVLKDASATAIYGSRGANGVVLITTKKGALGKIQVSYNGYIGIQTPYHKLELLDADQYKNAINNIIDMGGGDPQNKIGEIMNRTDWQDEIMNEQAPIQNHQVSFSGGEERLSYYFSLNYMNQGGVIKNSGFERYSARLNLNSQISRKLSLSFKITTSYVKNSFAAQGGGINEGAGALYSAYNYDPTLPVKDADNNYFTSPLITIDNPVALVNGINSSSKDNRTLSALTMRYSLASHLYAEGTVSTDIISLNRKSFISEITLAGQRNSGAGSLQGQDEKNYLASAALHYENKIGLHELNAFVGTSYQDFVMNNSFLGSANFPSTVLGPNNLGLGDQSTYDISTAKTEHRLASVIGRLNYQFNNKYLLTGTLRSDGSSRFGENNKYALFPSIALGWKINNENFLKDVRAIDQLKLRISWGEAGNQGIGNYQALSTMQTGQIAIFDNKPVTTTVPSRLADPNLKWEIVKEFDLGIDFGLWQGRVSGGIDYYKKNTMDMLLDLPVAQSTGFSTQTTNIGNMVNSGIEFNIATRNVNTENFSWTTDLNFSTLKNRIKGLGPLTSIPVGGGNFYTGDPGIDSVGQPINSFYGYKITGIWQEDDDFSVTKDNVKPGDFKFKDINGDSIVDGRDRVILGNSLPKFEGSITNVFNYKNFEFLFSIRGVYGISMLNLNLVDTYYPVNLRRNKFATPVLNRWTPNNPSDKYPSFVDLFDQGSKPINSYVVEDASYLKLDMVRFSYHFHNIRKIAKDLTCYFTIENVVAITNYDGIDPAINPQGNASYRIDYNTYPSSRTFLFGVDVQF